MGSLPCDYGRLQVRTPGGTHLLALPDRRSWRFSGARHAHLRSALARGPFGTGPAASWSEARAVSWRRYTVPPRHRRGRPVLPS